MFDIALLQSWAVGLLPFALGFLVLMVADFITGALLAWYVGDFDWEEAPRFLQTGVIYLWAWLVAEMLAVLPGVLQVEIPDYGAAIANIAPKFVYAAIVVGKYIASIVNNVNLILEVRNAIAESDDAPVE